MQHFKKFSIKMDSSLFYAKIKWERDNYIFVKSKGIQHSSSVTITR